MRLIAGRGEDKPHIKRDEGVNMCLVIGAKQMESAQTVRWQWDPVLTRCDT